MAKVLSNVGGMATYSFCQLYLVALTYLLILNVMIVSGSNPTIETDKGPIQGKTVTVLGKTIYQFLGVPYAEPPIGNLRYKRAIPVQSKWSTVRECVNFQFSCPQHRFLVGFFDRTDKDSPAMKMNEDCLYLNVMTPSLKSTDKLPVVFWIHGGSLLHGNAAWWHGQTLAAQENVVVVSINYRLGSFGFLAAKNADGSSLIDANNGLLDQNLALKWVRDNIAQFGGDSGKVVVSGHSAGSISATFHILSPQSRGLFQSAALYGGTCLLPETYYTEWSVANRIFDLFRTQTPCNDSHSSPQQSLECLQKLGTEDLLAAQLKAAGLTSYPFRPVVDFYFLQEDPAMLISQGIFNPVNVIIGTTANDGGVFTSLIPNYEQGLAKEILPLMVNEFYIKQPQILRSLIIHKYTDFSRPDDLIANREIIDRFLTEALFQAPVDIFASQLSKNGHSAYVFVFDHQTAHSIIYPSAAGVLHQMEVPYIYGYPLHQPDYVKENYTQDDQQVSIEMMKILGNLARNGYVQTTT